MGAWVTRFAPSPTGFLHLGHAMAAAYVCAWGRANNAQIILRMEDHDQTRCKKIYEEAILEDLEWLGLDTFFSSFSRQSDHGDRYESALKELKKSFTFYPCTCSRKDWATSSFYPGTCRHKPGDKTEKRLRMWVPDQAVQARGSDNVYDPLYDFLVKDHVGNWTYFFANVVDDLQEGVNFVIRGQDIEAVTANQAWLKKQFDLKEKTAYWHHPLLKADGQKLSKRDGAFTLAEHRNAGHAPLDLWSQIFSKKLRAWQELEDYLVGEVRQDAITTL